MEIVVSCMFYGLYVCTPVLMFKIMHTYETLHSAFYGNSKKNH